MNFWLKIIIIIRITWIFILESNLRFVIGRFLFLDSRVLILNLRFDILSLIILRSWETLNIISLIITLIAILRILAWIQFLLASKFHFAIWTWFLSYITFLIKSRSSRFSSWLLSGHFSISILIYINFRIFLKIKI